MSLVNHCLNHFNLYSFANLLRKYYNAPIMTIVDSTNNTLNLLPLIFLILNKQDNYGKLRYLN